MDVSWDPVVRYPKKGWHKALRKVKKVVGHQLKTFGIDERGAGRKEEGGIDVRWNLTNLVV